MTPSRRSSLSLSPTESCLYGLVQDRLCHLLSANTVYWKQWGRIKGIQAGDKNTKFFYTHASQRMRHDNL